MEQCHITMIMYLSTTAQWYKRGMTHCSSVMLAMSLMVDRTKETCNARCLLPGQIQQYDVMVSLFLCLRQVCTFQNSHNYILLIIRLLDTSGVQLGIGLPILVFSESLDHFV